MFNLKSPRSRKAEASRHKRLDHEMATAVREACDAASADMAREKWLELELERQRQLTDASTEQLACAEKDKQQLRHKIQQLENTLAQHETYAKLEAQGAQHVEMEMRKMHLQLKERTIELRSLQQELDGAKAQIRADQEAGAALGAAAASTSSTLEAQRKVLRQLFALVVRGSLAVQSLNAAMNQGPEGHAYYPAAIQQCMEVLEALIALRHSCAELLSTDGAPPDTLAELTRAATEAAAKSAAAAVQPRASSAPPACWRASYQSTGSAPVSAPAPARTTPRSYQPPSAATSGGYSQQMASVPETYAYNPAPAEPYQQPGLAAGFNYAASGSAPALSSSHQRCSSYQQQPYASSRREEPSKATAGHGHGHDSCNGRLQHTDYHSSVDCGYSSSQKGDNTARSCVSERHYSSSASDSMYTGLTPGHAASYFNGEHRSSSSVRSAGATQRSTGLEALKAATHLRQSAGSRRYAEPSTHADRTGAGSEMSYKSARAYDSDGHGSPYAARPSAGSMYRVQQEPLSPAGGGRESQGGRKWFW